VGRADSDSRACGETDKEAWEGNGGVSAGRFAGKWQWSLRWSSSNGRNELYSRFLELVEIFCFVLFFFFCIIMLHTEGEQKQKRKKETDGFEKFFDRLEQRCDLIGLNILSSNNYPRMYFAVSRPESLDPTAPTCSRLAYLAVLETVQERRDYSSLSRYGDLRD
jgi:hypothetical protein